MISVSILYPKTEASRFDVAYYVETHMPLAISLLGAHPGFKGVSVERGLGGTTRGTAPTYAAICRFQFNSIEDFLAAFTPHAAVLQGDIPRFTDVEPVIQFNDVLISR